MLETCTRRLEFDAAHRVHEHGGKCQTLHGHRYAAEITCQADEMTAEGFVIDFSIVKELVGGWIDEWIDHTTILDMHDPLAGPLRDQFIALEMPRKLVVLDNEPTAEHIAALLFQKATDLLEEHHVQVVRVRLYETPNCWADCSAQGEA